MVDLKDRVKNQFLPKLFEEVRKMTTDDEKSCQKILISSHGLFLKELHLYLKEMAKSKEPFAATRSIENTAVSSYDIEFDQDSLKILNVSCNYFACNKHVNRI